MFGIGGEHDLTERTLPHLAGWRGSRPVRVGNGAWNQRQIDVYGELLGAAHRLVAQLNPDHPGAHRAGGSSSSRCADTAARRWREKDQGIWEVRGEPRHFLYSKLMCWVALDRAIATGRHAARHRPGPAWRAAAEEIRAAILTEGWSDTAKSFTQSFGSDDLDASNLMIGHRRVPARRRPAGAGHDRGRRGPAHRLPRARLPLPHRERAERRRPRGRGGHVPALHVLAGPGAGRGRAGRPGPRRCSSGPSAYVNDVGLLAEEVDPATGDLLGNFPQAFSHIGLVNAAWAIAQAEE